MFNIDPTGKKVTRKGVVSMDINGVGEHGIILFILNYQQFLSTYQTKVHSNRDIKLFTRFIKNFGHLQLTKLLKSQNKWMKIIQKFTNLIIFFEQ